MFVVFDYFKKYENGGSSKEMSDKLKSTYAEIYRSLQGTIVSVISYITNSKEVHKRPQDATIKPFELADDFAKIHPWRFHKIRPSINFD